MAICIWWKNRDLWPLSSWQVTLFIINLYAKKAKLSCDWGYDICPPTKVFFHYNIQSWQHIRCIYMKYLPDGIFHFNIHKVHKVDMIWNSCRPDQLVEITLHEIDVDCSDGLVMVNSHFCVPSLLTIHLYQSTSASTIRCSTVGSSTGMCSPAQKITHSPWTRSSNYCLLWCNHPTHG